MTIKKWSFIILLLLFGGISILVIRSGSYDREDDLQIAEQWIEKGQREQAYYSLEKALEKSRKVYPEKEYWEFEDWYSSNLKIKAGVYQFRFN